MFEDAVKFLKNCSGKTVLAYDTDGDGIGAAVIVAKTLQRIFNKLPTTIPANHSLTKNVYNKIKKFKFVITVDMPIDRESEYILKLAKKSKILVIDHHQVHRNLNKVKDVTHINPQFWKLNIPFHKYCTSKIAYDICSKITNIEDLDWIAGLGIISDSCGFEWKEFLDRIYEKYPILKGKNLYSFDSKLGYISYLINSVYYYGFRTENISYKTCLESSPNDFLEAKKSSVKKLKKLYEKVENEIKETMRNWRKNAEIIESKKLIFLELKTKIFIQSPISTKISLEKPDYTVIVIKTDKKIAHISLRRRDEKVDCGKIAETCVKGLKNASGGGHIPAAGANIMKKDLERFKERIINEL
jgi:single-stranded DNA-specific DHH superfamily exonuclease